MITAIVNNQKVFPSKNILGICPYCGIKVRSRCGSINAWHFSHINLQESCDYWKEHESEWHREWKSWFPLENTEVIETKEDKKHIADIHLEKYIFELQNSPISYEERIAREEFWGIKLRWVVKSDFKKFKLLSFKRNCSGRKRVDGKFPRECISHYGSQLKEIWSEDFPVMWIWKNPKRWITTNPPSNFYIDLTNSNFILLVNKVLENKFGFGILKDRPDFIRRLKEFGVI